MNHILFCTSCSKYTMEKYCNCGKPTVGVKPAKFSPEDPVGKYRREARRPLLEKEGLL